MEMIKSISAIFYYYSVFAFNLIIGLITLYILSDIGFNEQNDIILSIMLPAIFIIWLYHTSMRIYNEYKSYKEENK